jgi:cytochrome c oxidase assembly protein subunit 15
MVTSKGAGLAVPDWPTTFGYNMFLFPISKWIGGIFFEHAHRLIASMVGFMTIILAVWLWVSEPRRWIRILGYTALAAVVIQGVLGGLRVTMLKDEIGIFHACLAQAFFGMLVMIALATSRFWSRLASISVKTSDARKLAWLAIAISAIVYLQLALGATMRHQHRDLSILDFPTAYGNWIPDLSPESIARINHWRDTRALSDVSAFQIWLQMAHRFVAVIITIGALAFWFAVRSRGVKIVALIRLSNLWLFLLACQIALGAWTIWSNKAADITTAHVAVGATIFAFGVAASAICLRLTRMQESPEQSFSSIVSEEAHAA